MEEINQAPEQELALRMYFFTIYQLMGMQGGIQSGHAALRFALKYGRYNPDHMIWDFIERHETWVVLNGGTTNDELDFDEVPLGTLNQIGDGLQANDIEFAYFREPDLNHALTALCFIADERVFNKKDYPDFNDFIIDKYYPLDMEKAASFKLKSDATLISQFQVEYKEWVRLVGGVKNVFLRDLLKGKKLA